MNNITQNRGSFFSATLRGTYMVRADTIRELRVAMAHHGWRPVTPRGWRAWEKASIGLRANIDGRPGVGFELIVANKSAC